MVESFDFVVFVCRIDFACNFRESRFYELIESTPRGKTRRFSSTESIDCHHRGCMSWHHADQRVKQPPKPSIVMVLQFSLAIRYDCGW